jgi:CubicO group peptidase (beta-lactamase class C family)
MIDDIDAIITTAIRARIFPGAVIVVTQNNRLLHAAAYGTTMYDDPGTSTVTLDTIYDLASLTKVFTATAALRLHDAGLLPLDRPVQHWLPNLHAADITIRHLLSHRSGLAVQLAPLARSGTATIREVVYATPPTHPPGNVTRYANVNTLLLGDVIAAVYGGSLVDALSELVCQPLGIRTTRFCPPVEWRARIAPTEWDEEWRGGLVHGVVHDESAYVLGGVAGHAGLFGSASDVLRLVQLFLQEGWWDGQQLLKPATVRIALQPRPEPDTHPAHPASGLGWMLNRPYMGAAKAEGFGHSGFTGPIIIGVPSQGLTIVLLCNRTYPKRTPPPYRHHAVSAAVVDSVLQSIGNEV